MTDHVFDPWATSTGLIESYTGKIVDAQFGFKPDYQNGAALLLMVDINTGDPEIGQGGIVSEQYPCGKGWDTHDGGQTAVHESGQDRNFNNSSGVGLLLNSIIEAGGLPGLQAAGPGPNHAATWIGGTYNFERKTFESTIDGKAQRWNRMLVTDLAGDGAPASAAPAAAQAPPVASVAPAAAPAATSHEVPVTVKAKLKSIALASDTHDAFVEAAFTQVPESMDSGPIEAAVGDPAWFASLKG